MKRITLIAIALLLIVPVFASLQPVSLQPISDKNNVDGTFENAPKPTTSDGNGHDEEPVIPGTPGIDTGGGGRYVFSQQERYNVCWNTATIGFMKTVHPFYDEFKYSTGRIWFPINEQQSINLEEVVTMMVALDPICSKDFWELIRPIFIN